jgi:hypothetical protein
MVGKIHRLAMTGAAALAPLALVTVVSPGVSNAVECGWGTVFDPPSNTCVAAPLPPPPPPPPPAWNGDLTPYFSVGICAPIPFVSLCTGI